VPYGGEALEKLGIILANPRDLGLLQHELGNQDFIRIAGSSPGEIATLGPKPSQQTTLEAERIGGLAVLPHRGET
jgi:hypothetical protein